MTEHELKLNQKYFDAVKNDIKTFEVRKNDRDFRIGDTLYLRKVDDKGEFIRDIDYTLVGTSVVPFKGAVQSITATVTYILTHDDFPDGVPEGYVVLGIKRKR